MALRYHFYVRTTDRRFLRTEKAITSALTRLLNKSEFQDLSMDDLISEADINRSTFYLHYRSLPDVLRTLENQLMTELHSAVDYRHKDKQSNLSDMLDAIEGHKKLAYAVFVSRSGSFLRTFEEFVVSNYFYDEKLPNAKKVNEKMLLTYSKIDSLDTIIRLWVQGGCRMKKEEVITTINKIFAL